MSECECVCCVFGCALFLALCAAVCGVLLCARFVSLYLSLPLSLSVCALSAVCVLSVFCVTFFLRWLSSGWIMGVNVVASVWIFFLGVHA